MLTPDDNNQILSKILDDTHYEQYCWNISEDQVLDQKAMDFISFNQIISGKELKQFMQQKSDYTIISINAKASYELCDKEIIRYSDFLNSPYEIILLCADDIYYEIYSKNMDFIEKIKANAVKNNFLNIEYITDENDGRTSMSVM